MFRPEHAPNGEVCSRCGVHASRHRIREKREPRIDTRSNKPIERIIGIDGEGIGRDKHRYIYLCASDEQGAKWDVAATNGWLSTIQCFELLLSLPIRSLIVGFSLTYDWTKILTDLPDRAIYSLTHENTRLRKLPNGRIVTKAITWNGYRINYMNRRFSLSRVGNKRTTTVWDIFAFFQKSFVKALEDWKVTDATEVEAIARMKEVRAELETKSREEIYAYCQKECLNLARLARSLIQAHKAAGLELKTYFGAGSTASVFLGSHGIAKARGEFPEAMRLPLACSFFGGRFENAFTGAVTGTVWSYDISSAYPYQTSLLPCLLCGHWTHSQRRRSRVSLRGQLTLVRWRSLPIPGSNWGGLPIRTKDGTIIFPLGALGGWTWRQEFEAAQQLNPTVEALEAWNYETDCQHKPFGDVPLYYRERVKLGKEAKGIVLKLGINSIYGKLAQSKGINPPFQCWIWAANITSGTRAQLLRLLSQDPSGVLMLATDGLYSRRRLKTEVPADTGTFDIVNAKGENVPLGGWEEKRIDNGLFCVRPGIYFPLNPTPDQIDKVRGRGLGRKSLYDNWQTIVDAWNAGNSSVTIGGMTRFVGMKSGILKTSQGITRRDCYGEWIPHSVEVSFAPIPKRRAINPDGSLVPWGYLNFESVPYDAAKLSADAIMLKLAELIATEQPDGDLLDLQ